MTSIGHFVWLGHWSSPLTGDQRSEEQCVELRMSGSWAKQKGQEQQSARSAVQVSRVIGAYKIYIVRERHRDSPRAGMTADATENWSRLGEVDRFFVFWLIYSRAWSLTCDTIDGTAAGPHVAKLRNEAAQLTLRLPQESLSENKLIPRTIDFHVFSVRTSSSLKSADPIMRRDDQGMASYKG